VNTENQLRESAPSAGTQEVKDAARYRWLCDHSPVTLLVRFFGNGCVNRTIDEVHAAIDAAMTKETPK
jgi:hypothetical protein